MVSKWRSHKLRMFMCVRAADSNIVSKEKELQRLLEVLRIKAETQVLVWDHLASMIETAETSSQSSYPTVSEEYLTAVNEFIRVKCSETAVSFIYLPQPSASSCAAQYVARLERMT